MTTIISWIVSCPAQFFLFLWQLVYQQLLIIHTSCSFHFQLKEKSRNLPVRNRFEVFGTKSLDLREDYCCLRTTDQEVRFPLGKAVLVITDIVGSTRLYNENPQRMKHFLDIHMKMVRCLLEKYSGHVVANEGDSFHLVFQYLDNGIKFSLDLARQHRELIPHFAVRIGVNKGGLCVRRLCGYKVFGKTVDDTVRFLQHNCGDRICIDGSVLEKHHTKNSFMFCRH